MKLESGRLKF